MFPDVASPSRAKLGVQVLADVQRLDGNATMGQVAFDQHAAEVRLTLHWIIRRHAEDAFIKEVVVTMRHQTKICVATRYRRRSTDGEIRFSWSYVIGDQFDMLQVLHPTADVERLFADRIRTRQDLPEDVAVSCLGGFASTGCFRVVLAGKTYLRHGDRYFVWFKIKHPRTGKMGTRSRSVADGNVIQLIDLAIDRHLEEISG